MFWLLQLIYNLKCSEYMKQSICISCIILSVICKENIHFHFISILAQIWSKQQFGLSRFFINETAKKFLANCITRIWNMYRIFIFEVIVSNYICSVGEISIQTIEVEILFRHLRLSSKEHNNDLWSPWYSLAWLFACSCFITWLR